MNRIEQEESTAEQMIRLYCRHKEGNGTLCGECRELMNYARARLEHCRFGERKPTCRTCPVHCYNRDMRARMAVVMRYSGPRMLIHHPLAAILHLWREFKWRGAHRMTGGAHG